MTTRGQNSQWLCTLANILAIIPPYRYLSRGEESRKKWYKWYTILVFLFITLGSALSIWGRFKDVYPNMSYTLVTTDLALNVCMTVTNICTILFPSFYYLEDFKRFIDTFIKTDNFVNTTEHTVKKQYSTSCIKLIVGHLLLALMLLYDGYVWIKELGILQYRHYIFRDFQNYHLYITVMIIHNFAVSMRYRFEGMNKMLQNVVNLPGVSDENSELYIQAEKCGFYNVVRQISQTYEQQIEQINLYNNIFGWQTLFLTLAIMMALINTLDVIIVFTFAGNSVENRYKVNLIILTCICSIWQLVLGIIIAVSCNKTSKEAQRTADICFSLLLRMPAIPESKPEKALRNELNLLNQLAVHRCPTFSAAGFFSIDYHLLLAILGSVTSYVIILVQFNM